MSVSEPGYLECTVVIIIHEINISWEGNLLRDMALRQNRDQDRHTCNFSVNVINHNQ